VKLIRAGVERKSQSFAENVQTPNFINFLSEKAASNRLGLVRCSEFDSEHTTIPARELSIGKAS
jgi:hypothetical protein